MEWITINRDYYQSDQNAVRIVNESDLKGKLLQPFHDTQLKIYVYSEHVWGDSTRVIRRIFSTHFLQQHIHVKVNVKNSLHLVNSQHQQAP